MARFCFLGAVSGLDVQFQNVGMEGGNVRDLMDSLKLCKKLIFRVPRQAGRNQVFSVMRNPRRQASRACSAHNTPATRSHGARHARSCGTTRSASA